MVESAVEPQAAEKVNKKVLSLSEAKQHTTEDDCWVVISGKVYDVTKFLDEHPGGYDIILTNTGQDASESFEEIGHSNAARDQLKKFYIGEYEGGAAEPEKPAKKRATTATPSMVDSIPVLKVLQVLLPIIVVGLAYVVFFGGEARK